MKVHHYLFSHKKNGYAPKLLSDIGAAVLLFVVVSLFAFSTLAPTLIEKDTGLAAIYAAVLEQMASEERVANGLPPLSVNPLLEKAAAYKADDMIAKGYFAHFSPDGTSPWHWISKAGYEFKSAGENLAIDFIDSKDVNAAWLNSALHRQNILSEKYTEVGVAVAQGMYQGRNTTFVVQMFGTPASTPKLVSAKPIVTTSLPISSPQPEKVAVVPAESNTVLGAEASAKVFETVVTNPKRSLAYAYLALGTLVILALMSIIIVGVKRHNIIHIFYGTGFIAFMTSLLIISRLISGTFSSIG